MFTPARHAEPPPAARRWRRAVAAAVAVALPAVALVAVAEPARADLGDRGQVTLAKAVDGAASATVGPGESFDYSFIVGCDDNPCVDATLVDPLPGALAGFTIADLRVTDPQSATPTLEGCAVGGEVADGCTLRTVFSRDLGELAGATQRGLDAGTTSRVTLTLTAPADLPPTWAWNGAAITNTATASAANTVRDATASATLTVAVPYRVDVTTTKRWAADGVRFEPGAATGLTLGVANASNVPAAELVLQDPQDAPDGAEALAASNPFRSVDLAGLCAPSALPEGADAVRLDVYHRGDDGRWSWLTGTPSASAALPPGLDPSRVGGLRFTYTGDGAAPLVAGGAPASECVSVTQRSTDRLTAAALVTGATVANTAAGTVSVPGRPAVTTTASDTLVVAPLTVAVTAGKQISPDRLPATGTFGVRVSARNDSNGPLTSLTLAEPGDGGRFLSDTLRFAGFTEEATQWPAGATGGTLVWRFSDGSTSSVALAEGAPPAVPEPPAGAWVTGFATTWTGAISPGASAGWSFDVATTLAAVPDGDASRRYVNAVDASGTNAAGTATGTAQAAVTVYAPTIGVGLDKGLSPARVAAGGTAVAELTATTSGDVSAVDPTRIVVTDVWDGARGGFWDAFRARSILFTDVPAGATMTVEYTTDALDPGAWTVLAAGVTGLYSADLPAGVRDAVVGLRFVVERPDGFAQGASVKPNVVFEAAATLRDGTTPTAVPGTDPTPYENLATAGAQGRAGGLPLVAPEAEDRATTAVVADAGGPGATLAGKRWLAANWADDVDALDAQSGAVARTVLGWGVTAPGASRVEVADAPPGRAGTPRDTAFQAFDLTAVRAVTYAQDPLLRWDTVSAVELYLGTGWVTVAPPGGSWMGAAGFTGYSLTAAESAAATGVRITVVPDDAARAAERADPTRPAPGTGVAWSGVGRALGLEWRLRNAVRVPDAGRWATGATTFNEPDAGWVRNDVAITATGPGGETTTRTAADAVKLVDTVPNVGVAKTASAASLVVPYPGDVPAAGHPTVDFTVSAWNAASSRASWLRVTDPGCTPMSACRTDPSDHAAGSVFDGRAYDPATNPFERLTLTGIAVATPAEVDRDASSAALWHRAADGSLSVTTLPVAGLPGLSADELADVVGVTAVYQSADPAATGGLLPRGARATLTLHTRLRDTLRSDPERPVTGTVGVDNVATAQGYDPVLAPSGPAAAPLGSDAVQVAVTDARLDVAAGKQITPDVLAEPAAGTPVQVRLTASDGAATMAPQSVTIADDDADFWAAFRLTGLGAVTFPAGADRVRVDVRLDGGAWRAGVPAATAALPAAVTDPARVTAVRLVFTASSGRPLSATVPSADWSASAVLQVRLRDGAAFPGVVENTVVVTAAHAGRAAVTAERSDAVTLSLGTPRLAVAKEPPAGSGHVVDPGEALPWTLTFANVGDSYLGITALEDTLGPWLRYAGTPPVYASAGLLPTTGIAVVQPEGGESLVLRFPAGSRMAPGDVFTVTLDVILLPGLGSGQQATNELRVVADRALAAGGCVNRSGNGQGVLDDVAADECGTSNYVKPRHGPLLFVEKEVRSTSDLVSGASNVADPLLPCAPQPGGWYRTVCAPSTSVGAADEWRIGAANTGTVPYTGLTFVDVLPRPGDLLLSTGAPRGSGFRPVLDGAAGVVPSVTPSGFAAADVAYEVTTEPAACVGAAGDAWADDPACSSTGWVAWASYAGDWADVTALRVRVDLGRAPLQPGELLSFVYRTVNAPATADRPDGAPVAPGAAERLAWNQVGAVATLTDGSTLARAPARTGVRLATGAVEVRKDVTGAAAGAAPDRVVADLACTVAGVPVDLGPAAALDVPAGGGARVDGIPLGARCAVGEHGSLGEYGESARTPQGPSRVAVEARVGAGEPVPVAQVVTLTNRYDPPVTTPSAAPDPPGTRDGEGPALASTGGTLASTGAAVTGLAALAALLVVGGCAAWRASRRRA